MPKHTPSGDARATAEPIPKDAHTQHLMRILLTLIGLPRASDPIRNPDDDVEQVLLDIDFEGARYLLIRMPAAERKGVQLSPRELEIVRMVAHGHQNKIIAVVLNISAWTVCTHLRRIFAKLGVNSRAAMVARLVELSGMAEQKIHFEPEHVRSHATAPQLQSKVRSGPRVKQSVESGAFPVRPRSVDTLRNRDRIDNVVKAHN